MTQICDQSTIFWINEGRESPNQDLEQQYGYFRLFQGDSCIYLQIFLGYNQYYLKKAMAQDLEEENFYIGEDGKKSSQKLTFFWEESSNLDIQWKIADPSISDSNFPRQSEWEISRSVGIHSEDEFDIGVKPESEGIQIKSKINQVSPKEQKKMNCIEWSKKIMKVHQRQIQEKNTPRFLVRLLIKYFSEFQQLYPPDIFSLMKTMCQEELNNSKSKKGVFLMKNLRKFLENDAIFGKLGCSINRKVFFQILSKHALFEMFLPKSQIKKNKTKYLQTSKVFKLRCRSKSLISRLQSQ